jgi:hypothetical protein
MKGEPVPAHVSIILDGQVRIVGADALLKRELLAAGLNAHHRRHGLSIVFARSRDEGDLFNDSLIETLRVLAAHDVAFFGGLQAGIVSRRCWS